MDEIQNIAGFGIGGALSIVAAIVFLWFKVRRNRYEKTEEGRALLEAELADAVRAHAAHLRGGDVIEAIREARRIDRLRRRLGYKKEDRK